VIVTQALRSALVSLVALLLLAALASPSRAQEPPLFRLFLTDGTIVACLGEYARLDDSVVCSLPLDAADTAALVTLEAALVDWQKSEAYARSLRAALYAESRGEHDFAELSVDVARMLNEIGQTTDDARRLGLALEARRRLADWPAEHHNYRARDVQQILQLVDDAISDFRAASGAQQFDLAFHATAPAEPAAVLLPVPTAEQRAVMAAAVASRLSNPTERLSLLEAITATLTRASGVAPSASLVRLRREVDAELATERATDGAYTRFSVDIARRSRAAAARADVRGVERTLATIAPGDRRLGARRPDRIAALLATVQADLDAARRLRLAQDQWTVKAVAFRSYKQSVARPVGELTLMARGLDDIKRLAGPAAPVLRRLASRAAAAARGLSGVVPPSDLAAIHALFLSAAQLAGQAVAVRQHAVESGEMDRAWQASSAAAGALMLLQRAERDLAQALVPPVL
jgi:hypothetical protein